MKNKPTLILSAIILLALGFSVGIKYRDLVPKSPTNPQTDNANELFANKTECQKYQNDIEKKLDESNIFVPETGAQTVNTFDKIFYSPKAKSCLYVSTDIMFVNGKRTSEIPTLRDTLSGETLLSGIREWGADDYFDRMEQFESGVKEYE